MGIFKGAMLVFATVGVMAATSSSSMPSSSSTGASTTTAANTTEATTGKSWYQKLKDSPFNMQFLAEGSNGFTETIKSYSFYNYLYLGYNINKDWAVKIVPYWQTDIATKEKTADGKTKFYQKYGATQGRVYAKNLLTEEKHGFSLMIQDRLYYYPEETRSEEGYDAKNRVYLIGSKKITDKFSIGTYAFVENYIRNTGKSKYLSNYYAAVAPTYYINDKLYTALTVEYYVQNRRKGNGEAESISVSPEVGYSFSAVSLSAALALEPIDFRDNDNSFYKEDTLKNASLVVSAFFPIF